MTDYLKIDEEFRTIIPPLTADADDKVEQLLNASLQISGWEGHEQDL